MSLFYLLLIYFVLIFLYPGSYLILKTLLMFLFSFFPIIRLNKFSFFETPKRIYIMIFLWISYFGLMLNIGILNGYPDPNFRFIFRWFFLLPLSFSFGYFLYKRVKLKQMHNLLIITTSIVLIASFIYYFITFFSINSNISDLLFPSSSFSGLRVTETSLSLRQGNQPSLIFLVPFNIFYFYFSKNKSDNFNYFALFNIVLGTANAALSGRRSLQYAILLILIILLFNMILRIFSRLKLNKGFFKRIFSKSLLSFRSLIFVSLTFIIFYFLFDSLLDYLYSDQLYNAYFSTLLAPFQGALDRGTNMRFLQIDALYNKWLQSPLIGHGLNAYTPEVIRNAKNLWSYEMFYIALLMQTGMIGLTIFLSTIYVSMFGFTLKFKSHFANLPMVVYSAPYSILLFFFAASTNPFWDNFVIWTLVFYYSLKLKNKNVIYEI